MRKFPAFGTGLPTLLFFFLCINAILLTTLESHCLLVIGENTRTLCTCMLLQKDGRKEAQQDYPTSVALHTSLH